MCSAVSAVTAPHDEAPGFGMRTSLFASARLTPSNKSCSAREAAGLLSFLNSSKLEALTLSGLRQTALKVLLILDFPTDFYQRVTHRPPSCLTSLSFWY